MCPIWVLAYTTTAADNEDGINWTGTTLPSSVNSYSICYGNGKFVAVASRTNTGAYSEYETRSLKKVLEELTSRIAALESNA